VALRLAGHWHSITVANLRALLATPLLLDTDVLVPNDVNNLAVFRGDEYVGYIDLGDDETLSFFGPSPAPASPS
jgi:hypothetical protein